MDLSRDRKVPLFTDEALSPGPSRPLSSSSHPFHIQDETLSPHELPGPYRVYKRRWFGLAQLSLLNLIVSWDWLTFAPVASTSAEYYDVSISAVNWLSTAFLFAFVVAAPVVMLVLNKGGPKPATVACSALILVGNWLRYAGTRARPHGSSGGIFGLVMAGQILIGLAQPFVLAAPTRYSELWFTENGRISATAVASLANPLGGALGQLIDPLWCTKASEVPNMVLYVAIISTLATLPTLFLPSAPPTPPSSSSTLQKPSLTPTTLRTLLRNPSFHLLLLPFSIYVAAFNALSSLLTQTLLPYAFTESQAGITGGLLILVGLLAAALTSPLLDRHKPLRLPFIKTCVPVLAASYVAFTFAPPTRNIAAPYVIASVLGAASFALVPVVLEALVEVTWPVGAEVGSTACWTGGQALGGVFIVVMDALQDAEGRMGRALVFLAVVCCLVAPLPLCLGYFGTGIGRRAGAEREMERERGPGMALLDETAS